MTLDQFREDTKDLPGDYIICTTGPYDGHAYEISGVETLENVCYYDVQDDSRTGNIIQL